MLGLLVMANISKLWSRAIQFSSVQLLNTAAERPLGMSEPEKHLQNSEQLGPRRKRMLH
jgi:hypothetical protein